MWRLAKAKRLNCACSDKEWKSHANDVKVTVNILAKRWEEDCSTISWDWKPLAATCRQTNALWQSNQVVSKWTGNQDQIARRSSGNVDSQERNIGQTSDGWVLHQTRASMHSRSFVYPGQCADRNRHDGKVMRDTVHQHNRRLEQSDSSTWANWELQKLAALGNLQMQVGTGALSSKVTNRRGGIKTQHLS